MPLLHDALEELGLGDWWRSTIPQAARGFIELLYFHRYYVLDDEMRYIPQQQLDQIASQLAERYQADSLLLFLENFAPQEYEDESEMLSPQELKMFEEWFIERIENIRYGVLHNLHAVRKQSEQEIEEQIIERYKRKPLSKKEARDLNDFGFFALDWIVSDREMEKIDREVAAYIAERYEPAFKETSEILLREIVQLLELQPESVRYDTLVQCVSDKLQEFVNMDDILEIHEWYGKETYKSIEACEKQIAIAPEVAEEFKRRNYSTLPWHAGYSLLTKIREKEKDYAEAIRLATQAKEQGWEGDWDKRIERYKVRLQNQERRANKQSRKS